MKKTMSKEGLIAIMRGCENYDADAGFKILDGEMFIDALSEAGISFDIYIDSDGQIIKPGDVCEFWNSKNFEYKDVFIGKTSENDFVSNRGFAKMCRKFTIEVWEPVPMEDVLFGGGEFDVIETVANPLKWKECKNLDGKLMGVRK